MVAVELAFPQAALVSVSKLMGSEGLGVGVGGGVGVSVANVDETHSGCNSVESRPSVDVGACSRTDKIPATNAMQPHWKKGPDAGYLMMKGQPSSFHAADAFEDFNLERKDGSASLLLGLDSKQSNRRSVKVPRSNSGGSKRSRIVQMEVSVNEYSVEDIKSYPTGTEMYAAKGVVAEKMQIAKQRNIASCKRGDKRTGRIPKSRCDTFSLKNGLVSFSTVSGAGNIPVYGSKSNFFDVSNHVDELPLNELLDGSYNCPSLMRDKAKGAEDSSENFLTAVRKAFSVLRVESTVHAQNSVDRENNFNQTPSVGAVASPTSRNDKGICSVNQSSADKLSFEDDSCRRISTLTSLVKSPIWSPKDILQHLSLPPSKELDSLLLDAMKSASSSRNNTDVRLGKSISHRTGMPPFPWSHNSSGHSKSGPDAVKLSANRTTCHGRWIKVENSLIPLKDSTGFLVDLESLTYDNRLVPVGNLESGPLGSEKISSSSVPFSSSERVLSSSTACSASEVPQGEHSPGLMAAAETLCEIAANPLKQNSIGMVKLMKRPSRKTMKGSKLKLNEKSQRPFVAPKSGTRPDNLLKVTDDGILPSKKLKLSMQEKTKGVCHTNPPIKVSTDWSSSRSIRSSQSKVFRDPVAAEPRNHHTNSVKKSYVMPPPARVIDKTFDNQQKLKKIGPME